jgi:hypothetical protein
MNPENKIVKLDEEIDLIRAKLRDPNLCKGTLDCQTRVSGYYRSTVNFNEGKAQEYSERNEYRVA